MPKRVGSDANHTGNPQGQVIRLDELDIEILDKVHGGTNAKKIASDLSKPLSTVQRRVRRLFEQDAIRSVVDYNYKKLGLKRGEIFVYLEDGDSREIAKQIAVMDGMLGVSIHIGNSDIVGSLMYRDSADLLQLISKVRHIGGVEKVVWSEEIYRVPVESQSSLSSVIRRAASES